MHLRCVSSRLWRNLLALALLALAAVAQAQTIKLLVQSSPLAGFRYHEAPAVWNEMKVGDVLILVREPNNPHDPNAIRVEWRGRMLGYLPRAENRAVAGEMDRGGRVEARVARLQEARNPWQRVLIEIFAVL
jgi:HIRAN domain